MNTKLSTAQHELLTRLASPPCNGTAVARHDRGWHTRVVRSLRDKGLLTIAPGGTTSTCPRTGVGVFTPGDDVITITDAGREALR